MLRRVTCPHCQTPYNLPDSQLGKQLRCRRCQSAFRVPAAPTAADHRSKPVARPKPAARPTAPAPQRRGPNLVVVVAVAGGLLLLCVGLIGGGAAVYLLTSQPRTAEAREREHPQAESAAPVPAPTTREVAAPAPRPPEPPAPSSAEPELWPTKAVVGHSFQLTLPVADGARCTVESGPVGLRVVGRNLIVWVPTRDAVGSREFTVRVRDGAQTTLRRFRVEVQPDTAVAAAPPASRPGVRPPAGGPGALLPDMSTLPVKAVSGKPFRFQLPNAGGTVRYELHPGFAQRFKDLHLSPEGLLTWTPPHGWPARPLVLTLMANGMPRSYNLEVEEDPSTVLSLPAPAGWVMLPDGVTLIASLPQQGQLVYVDTVAAKETKRVDVSFRPTELALQGGNLFAVAEGSGTLYVLDLATGKVKKEVQVSAAPLRSVACHPRKGLVYVSNGDQDILGVDPASGKVHATGTHATGTHGMFLAVDPVNGDAVYAGIQGQIKDVIVVRRIGSGRYTVNGGVVGARAGLLKYAVQGTGLQAVGANENPADNGKVVRVSADGKEVGVVGGGGYQPPAGAGTGNLPSYGIALFSTDDVKSMRGVVACGAYPANLAFHPVLDLGVAEQDSIAMSPVLHVFNSKSLVEVATVPFGSPDGGNFAAPPDLRTLGQARPEASLLTFGAKGTKLIYHEARGSSLRFLPLQLSDADRAALEKAYGKLPPAA